MFHPDLTFVLVNIMLSIVSKIFLVVETKRYPYVMQLVSRSIAVGAREVLKNFPEARQTDKQTPFNERKKMGHFSWAISKSLEKIIVNLYVVHKVRKH